MSLSDSKMNLQAGEKAEAMIFQGPHQAFEWMQLPIAELKQGEVLVRVLYATICTSDLHTFSGRRTGPTPCLLGHEIIGEVVAIGAGQVLDYHRQSIAVGDRITWTIYAHDHQGAMAALGLPQKSPDVFKYGHQPFDHTHPLSGGFATHCHLKSGTDLFKLPLSLSYQEAAPLNCTHATIAGALRMAGGLIGKNVLVVGAGMLGLSACAMTTESGAQAVAVLDINSARAAKATAFGATVILSDSPQLQAEQIASMGGVDVIIETSGVPEAMEKSLDYLNIGGICVWVGAVFQQRDLHINAERVVRKLITIKGLHNYIPADLDSAIRFFRKTPSRLPFS